MAELHPTFDRANRVTAEQIVDRVVAASDTSIVGYDEGNPGSSREVRVHTGRGRIWVSPTRVYVPDAFAPVDDVESEQLEGARSYLLPTRVTRRDADADDAVSTVLCDGCFIRHPADRSCPYCSPD